MPKKIIIAGAGLDGQPVTITGLPGTPLEGQSKSVLAWGTPPEVGTSLTALGGRIAVFDQAITNPSAGEVVARADGKTTLNLRGVTSAQAISAMIDGLPGQIEVAAIERPEGFVPGEHYWLAQDGDGRFAPTPGRRHRKIYVSTSPSAMTRAMIAAHAGVAESAVTGAWLSARPIYGGSPSLPLAWDTWLLLTDIIHGRGKAGRSDWIFFERGYEYGLLRNGNNGNGRWTHGESELHPIVFADYGTGAWPKFVGIAWNVSSDYAPKNVIFRNLHSVNTRMLFPMNQIFEGGRFDGGDYMQFNDCQYITIKDAKLVDHWNLLPTKGGGWSSAERVSASYIPEGRDILLDGCLVDQNGWHPDYDYNLDPTKPQPHSSKNHGLYWSTDVRGVTTRDSIVSRNASCGFQVRCGSYSERILFLYNNIAYCGDSDLYGNYTTLLDSVVFGAGFKKAVSDQGELQTGFDFASPKSVAIGCIVAHTVDPANPVEIANGTGGSPLAYKGQPDTSSSATSADWLYHDIQVYKWGKKNNGQWFKERVDGLSEAVLDATTIQKYTQQKLGDPTADQYDLYAHARLESTNVKQLAQDAIRWTKARFGSPLPAVRTAPAMLTFLPDWRTEGFRWDNRRNWSSFDLPGTHIADSVDLDGNFVRFGTLTASIAALTSKGGILDVTSGKLTVGAITDAAKIRTRLSGQIVIPATTQPLSVMADSGLTQITGAVTNLDMEVRGHAEVLLGPDCTVPAGKSLVISGQRPLVGWDGTGSATLTVAGTLEFRAGMMLTTSGAGKNPFLITGKDLATPNFSALVGDYEEINSAGNRLWLDDVTGLPVAGEVVTVGHADKFATKEPHTLTVTAIASRGVAPLQRFRSGAVDDGLTEPTVNATVVLAAGAQIVTTGFGPGTHDLGGGAGTGVTYVDQGATLPAGVSLTAGKLVLTVS